MAGHGGQYRHNHYVPEWYQRRFLPPGVDRFHYLDLHPDVRKENGHTWTRRDLLHRGPERCFAQDDLYTTRWGSVANTEIEQFFFGELDGTAPKAVDFFATREPHDVDGDALQTFMRCMSVQKLRTPKGLAWLASMTGSRGANYTLLELQRIQQIFCATWTDCVWQIADASQSPTKFIVSDHPVTIYNRDCFPGSPECRPPSDPDIRLVGTHTLFPLSLDKVAIFTNLAWVRDPYQNPTRMGPNDRLFRHTIFNFTDIQFGRFLSEEEVREINYIIKRRAFRYVAAAEKDWLYPERHLRDDHWRKLGDGYLLMPDPRHVHMGGTTYVGYEGGGSEAWGAYGHRPWEQAFEDKGRDKRESHTLEKFKAEWSAMMGPAYRGRSLHLGGKGAEAELEKIHEWHLEADRKELAKSGERARRRRLRRS